MYLISSELQALEEISKMCGEVKSKEKEKTASTPLVTVSDLQRLKQFEVISLRLRKHPFKTKLTPNWQMDWGKNYEKATYPTREKKPVELFAQHVAIGRVKSWQLDGSETYETYSQEDVNHLLSLASEYKHGKQLHGQAPAVSSSHILFFGFSP